MAIQTTFGFTESNGSAYGDFSEISNFQPIRNLGGHLWFGQGHRKQFWKMHPRSITSEFGPLWPSDCLEEGQNAKWMMKKWPWKRGGLSWEGQFTSILLSQYILNLAWKEDGL